MVSLEVMSPPRIRNSQHYEKCYALSVQCSNVCSLWERQIVCSRTKSKPKGWRKSKANWALFDKFITNCSFFNPYKLIWLLKQQQNRWNVRSEMKKIEVNFRTDADMNPWHGSAAGPQIIRTNVTHPVCISHPLSIKLLSLKLAANNRWSNRSQCRWAIHSLCVYLSLCFNKYVNMNRALM